jgi:Zn-dependent peptidase ImmA (M78 family)
LVRHLRALTPGWPISRREARWIAERQARLLLADAGITTPPVPERIVTGLEGITVYPLAQMPVKGLLSASQPNGRGGDILIDSTLPLTERRVALLHELKYVIDGGKPHVGSSEPLCTDFALRVLIPASWLQADWQAGCHDVRALAERYQVRVETMQHRLHMLGLRKLTRRQRRVYCQSRQLHRVRAST